MVLPQVFGIFREQPSPAAADRRPALGRAQIGALRPDGGPPARRDVGRPARPGARPRARTAAQPDERVRRGRAGRFSTTRTPSPEARCGCRRRLARRSTPHGRRAPTTPVRPSSSRRSNGASPRSTTSRSGCSASGHGMPCRSADRSPRPHPARGRVPEAELLDLVATSTVLPEPVGQPAADHARPARGSRRRTSGSTTSPSRSWCTHGATTARRPSGTTRSRRTETSSRRASSSPASRPAPAPAARCRARPAWNATYRAAAGSTQTAGPGDARATCSTRGPTGRPHREPARRPGDQRGSQRRLPRRARCHHDESGAVTGAVAACCRPASNWQAVTGAPVRLSSCSGRPGGACTCRRPPCA